MLSLKSISPSRIKTYDTCLFQYWLKYVKHATMRSNWGASHGTLIHDLLENIANENDPDWMRRLYEGYGGTLDTLDRYGEPEVMESPLVWAKPKEYHDKRPMCDTCQYVEGDVCGISREPLSDLPGCPKSLFEESVTMMHRVLGRYEEIWPRLLRNDRGVPIGTEYAYNIALPGRPDVPMIGIMDLVIEEDPETIHVMDYKAGKKTQDYGECMDDIQVRMYSLAARREFVDDVNNKGYRYKNVLLTFDYFRGKPITVAFSAEQDAKTEEEVVAKINEIEATDWIDRIVRNNEELVTKTRFGQVAFTCKYLCDSDVCKREWQGRFRAGDDNENQ